MLASGLGGGRDRVGLESAFHGGARQRVPLGAARDLSATRDPKDPRRPLYRSGLLGVVTVRKCADARPPGRGSHPVLRLSAYACIGPQTPPVTYAADPKRHLSPTPPTLIGDVDGTVDRLCVLSLA